MGCEAADTRSGSVATLRHFQEILSSRIAHYGGTAHHLADAVLIAEFEDAANAVNCAISVQEQVAHYNQPHLDEGCIGAKIALHFGDLSLEAGQIKGSGLETLRDVLAKVPEGKIYLTRDIYARVRVQLDLKYEAVEGKDTGTTAGSAELLSVDWEAVAGNLKASIKRLGEDDLPRSMSLASKLGAVPSKRPSPVVLISLLLFIFLLFKFLKWL